MFNLHLFLDQIMELFNNDVHVQTTVQFCSMCSLMYTNVDGCSIHMYTFLQVYDTLLNCASWQCTYNMCTIVEIYSTYVHKCRGLLIEVLWNVKICSNCKYKYIRQMYIFTKLYKYMVHVYTIIQMCRTYVQNYTSVQYMHT